MAIFHQRAFLDNLYILVLFLLLRTTGIRKKREQEMNCEIIPKKASGTLCLSQPRDSKFEAYSFSSTLKVLFTARDVIICSFT